MTNIEQLVEQHIRESESRRKHVDELLQRADAGVGSAEQDPELVKTLRELREERDRLAAHAEELRFESVDRWRSEEIELAGPMAVWDALAQSVEQLVERLEGSR